MQCPGEHGCQEERDGGFSFLEMSPRTVQTVSVSVRARPEGMEWVGDGRM